MSKKVVIIGGGPAGMMAAISASESKNTDEVILIEKNAELGKKLKITGGGRCNVTNDSDPSGIMNNVVTNKKFLTKSLQRFTPKDLMELIEKEGCPLKVEENGTVFPKSESSQDIVQVFHKLLNRRNVQLNYQVEVERIMTDKNHVTGIRLRDGKKITADRVILATGGFSYPKTGSTGSGYELARELGHTITPLRASLVPMEIREKWLTDLSGISFKNIIIKTKSTKKSKPKTFQGDLLITHFGISGPAPFQLSTLMKDMEIPTEGHEIAIDFVPNSSHEKLQDEFNSLKQTNKQVSTILTKYWPKNFVLKLLEQLNIGSTLSMNQLSKKDKNKLITNLKDFKITILKLKSIKEATVTSGGVSVKEVDPSTMESKKITGLYFAGEVLDVDALSGGFNLQIAFSTGHLAGDNCV
ncbi:NAD(P)/FAD-dependent oxidoreductase [Natranaerobius thermophilus]|uniref:HI0933 family protein n=1 Tax=Natranaerobius thermophilus (strain ATCC BAA-1301 / DSM 18059 / JW/NM-WN-LF) TaxID=457570 RepID=B2A880_NATTJ|nr:NAD(P)/FAD-dependent oxidoreductase [Natranaerobius thermophilus]ACB84446.1 HI0933 family protein [Natranaerobius thermophilus JW/NM-WN-LF]